LTTETVTYSDIENKAKYEASSVGVNVNTSASAKQNESGVTPNIGVPSSDKASSTTKSAIAAGTVQNHNGEKINLESLSREANTVTDALGKIFDKTSVKEKQELSQRFGEEAYNLVHVISEKNGWAEGSKEKVALHALVGGLMAKLGSGDVLSGATGAGFNEAIQTELSKIQDPAARQWASTFVGAVAAKVITGNAQTGGSTAASGTKNNALDDDPNSLYTAMKKFARVTVPKWAMGRLGVLGVYKQILWDDMPHTDPGTRDPNTPIPGSHIVYDDDGDDE